MDDLRVSRNCTIFFLKRVSAYCRVGLIDRRGGDANSGSLVRESPAIYGRLMNENRTLLKLKTGTRQIDFEEKFDDCGLFWKPNS